LNREPPRITVALNAFGCVSVLSAVLFLGGSFYVENDIGKAFCLGAFFSGLLGSVLLFGFAKVIDLLDTIRVENRDGKSTRGEGVETL
jgi:hypothetical protein